MDNCSKYRSLLPLFSGGELNEAEVRDVQAHLARCEACVDEEAIFSQVIGAAKQVTSIEIFVPESSRRRISLEAAARASRTPWGLPMPMFSFSSHPGLLAGVAAVLLALVALPVAMRHGGSGLGGRAEVSTIEITSYDGVVKLAWNDGSRDAYKVYKGSDPRNLGRGEVHVVKGNIWTDSQPGSSPIVFYKIE